MKTVLIIAYYFPPSPAVGGLRPRGLAKYLPEFGWQPVVLTVKLPGREHSDFTLIESATRESFGLARRILGLDPQQNLMTQIEQLKGRFHVRSQRSMVDVMLRTIGQVVFYPDPQRGWRSLAVESGDSFLRQTRVDALMSTSSPVTGHRVARQLKDKYGIPWVADFRDLWTQNYYYPYGRLRRRVERRLEINTISKADAIVTVAEPLAAKLGELHKDRPIHVITNGFDPAELNVPDRPLTDTFTITYTGNLYPGRQSPELLFAALRDLIANQVMDENRIQVRFYGVEAGWIDDMAERQGVKRLVRQFGIVPRETALDRQRESQVLLFLKWNDFSNRGAYSAKVFEYLAAGRPVLALGGCPDVVSDLLGETGAGTETATATDAGAVLRRWYQQYVATGSVEYSGDPKKIERYSQRRMAEEYSRVLDEVWHKSRTVAGMSDASNTLSIGAPGDQRLVG